MPSAGLILAEEPGRKLRTSLDSMLSRPVRRGFTGEIGLTYPRYRDSVEEGFINIFTTSLRPRGIIYTQFGYVRYYA